MSLLPNTDRLPLRTRVALWFLTTHVGPLRGGGLWGSVAVILAFLAVSIPQYGQPYVIDEAVFPYSSAGILQHGAPFFYNGETRPNDVGLWHPPLYEYLLALEMLFFGTSSFVVRSFGAICVIASFYVLTLALRRIAPEVKQYGYVALAALFLLNPLVVSDSLVPDIDGTLGILLVAFALWIATVVVQRPLSWRLAVGLFAFATLAISTKYIIAGIVAAIIGCATLLSPEHRWRKFLRVVVAFAAGAAVSVGVLFALGALLKFDARGPFIYLFGSLGSRSPGRTGLSGAINDLLSGPGSNVVWIGPAILASGAVAMVIVFVMKPLLVSRSLVVFVVASSLVILVGYSYITASPFTFPKYTNVVVPGLALAGATLATVIAPLLPSRTSRGRMATRLASIVWVLVVVVGTAATFALACRYEVANARTISGLMFVSAVDFVGVLVATVVVIALLRLPKQDEGGRSLLRLLVIGVIAALIVSPVMVQTSASLVNLSSPYSTRYYYGERGMSQFLVQANKIIPSGATIITAKDVGLQLHRPFYEDAGLLPLMPSRLRMELRTIKAPYLVTRKLYDYSESVYPTGFEVFREFYTPILTGPSSDFVLWKLK